ncbi:MAG: CesT family type III secretion system chaperone [Herminiimonas sp.]|nr:CesT family type III secretion system chaperone [Herminiimonas sp.]
MKKKFEELVTGLCALKNLPSHLPFIDGAPMRVNGTMCSLLYNERSNPERFFLYVVFGYAPHDREAMVFKALLQQNHAGYEGRGSGFCISATSGKVGYSVSIALSETTPNELASSMAYYAALAATWRETFFLEKRRRRSFRSI